MKVRRGGKVKRQCGVSHKASIKIIAEPWSVRKGVEMRAFVNRWGAPNHYQEWVAS